jgi:AcrR family transcriptional regulator
MSGTTLAASRTTARRNATRVEILEAAWATAREHGLLGISMRELGERVGMRAQSLYSYFSSKHAIHDAMFEQGWTAFLTEVDLTVPQTRSRRAAAAEVTRVALQYFDFCTADPVRHQLMFQRTIPGFEPSEQAYAASQRAFAAMVEALAAVGVRSTAQIDMWTAVMIGLTSQQLSNDPGGDRWRRLVRPAVQMLLTPPGG